VAATTPNVLIYATSNRRHLLPEYMKDNLSYTHTPDGEVHPGEVIEEKISLSERFGLWVSFYSFSQDEYLAIVAQWLDSHLAWCRPSIDAARAQALVWALERGSRSGRVAYQFARDYAGQRASPAHDAWPGDMKPAHRWWLMLNWSAGWTESARG
jgi:predicted AAA+ superfamily ATPase